MKLGGGLFHPRDNLRLSLRNRLGVHAFGWMDTKIKVKFAG
jgi:hypothetical protein